MKKQILLTIIVIISVHLKALSQAKSFSPVQSNERRIALVIGNKDYEFVSRLKNPINDALDITASLMRLGFEVVTLQNADYRTMSSSWNNFVSTLSSSDVVMLYYSGHGASYGGKNYLLPIDAKIACLEQVEEYGISLNRINVDLLSQRVKNSFIFLDACRNLPSLKVCSGNSKDLILQSGFVKPINNPRGSMIVYATREGSTADDNPGERNGAFTGALLKFLETPNVGIRSILDNTFDEVERETDGKQIPGRYDELKGDFVFIQSIVPKVVENVPVTKPIVVEPAPQPQVTKVIVQEVIEPKLIERKDLIPFEPQMIFVPSGIYKMGNDAGESGEYPSHFVSLDDFSIGKFEVTVGEYLTFVEEVKDHYPAWLETDNIYNIETGTDDYYKKLGYSKNSVNLPIVGITYDNAVAYCEWLSKKTVKEYRLPTEAEWEYAAGGGEKNVGLTFAGSLNINQVGWMENNSQSKPHEIGTKKANELNLHDMTGNVWEWCSDWYSKFYYLTNPQSTQNNPKGPNKGVYRVIRGGSWNNTIDLCEITQRAKVVPSLRDNNIGFRIVQVDKK